MPVQYLYPDGDKQTSNWMSTNYPTFYTSVDDGVLTPNDSEIIYDNGFATNTNQAGPIIQLSLTEFTYIPSSISIYVRAAKQGGGSYYTYVCNPVIYNSGNQVIASGADYLLGWNNGTFTNKSGNLIMKSPSYYDSPYLAFHLRHLNGFWSLMNLAVSEVEIRYSGDTRLNTNKNTTMYILGDINISGENNLYTSGNYQTFEKTTLYIADIVYGTGNMDMYIFGCSGKLDSGVPLHLQLCSREARLQPLYDNESSGPYESGYEGTIAGGSSSYQGINYSTKWGFYSTLEQALCTNKYHFAIDDYDEDVYFSREKTYLYNNADLMYLTFYSPSYGYLQNTTNYLLTNNGFTVYESYSGHRGDIENCGIIGDVGVFNPGYGSVTNLNIFQTNSGMIFDNQKAVYMWFNVVDSGSMGDRTYLFSIANGYAQWNPGYPYNRFAVYYEGGSRNLVLQDDYTEQIIATDVGSGWHLIGANVYRTNATTLYTEWYLDGQYSDAHYVTNDITYYADGDGRWFYVGKDYTLSNVGNITFLTDYFSYCESVVDFTEVYNLWTLELSDTNNYFESIGCTGLSEYYCPPGGCINRTWGDTDYLYSQPPARGDDGWCSPNTNYIYYYDGSNSSFNTSETHNVVDFQSRGLDLVYGPYDTYLRFRADIDTKFKVTNILVTDENSQTLASKVGPITLDGYGTCGPYEVQLDTAYFSSGTFNPSRTRIFAEFYVDTGCLGYRYPTGLVHASQTDNNFRNQYRNMRTFSYWNGFFQVESPQSGYGIVNNHIESEYWAGTPNDEYRSKNTFGYEYSGIDDTTHQKWLGIRLNNYQIYNYSGSDITLSFRLYDNYNSGNSYIYYGYFNMCTQPEVNFTSGDVIYWSQLPTNIGTGDFQIGFYFSNDNYNGNLDESLDIQLGSAPFVYLDMTNEGVSRLGQIKITQLDVAFEIPCNPTGINDVITLYTAGVANTGIDIPLYTSGMPHGYGYGTLFIDGAVTEELPLYIKGGLTANMPLYINGFGGTETKNLTLFLAAEESGVDYGAANNTQTLYIKSVPVASGEGFDLYIAGPDSGYMYENIPLYIEGYGGSSTDATTLYIQALESGIDYGYGIGTSDLYLNGIAAHSGDPFSLYISAPTSGYLNDGMPLYLNNLDAWTGLNSGTDLYIQTLESGNRLTTLFINSFGEISGDPFNLHISGGIGTTTLSNTLYVNGEQAWRDNITLFLANATPVNDILNLYVKGTGNLEVGYRTLFISGDVDDVNNVGTLFISGEPFPFVSGELLNLYINGGGIDNRTDIVDLYLYAGGDIPYLNSVNLHIVGGFEYGEFPLSLYNDDTPILKNKTATLFTNGFSGVLGKLEQGCIFYIDGTSPNDSMNLYLHNSGIHSHYNTYPLYLGGKDITYSGIANWNTLYIQNEYLHIDYGCEMYLNSQEAYEESGDFNLFIARSTEAIAGNTNLYLAATNGSTSEFAMYISGATYSQNNVNLSIPYVESTIINNAKLYTHGY